MDKLKPCPFCGSEAAEPLFIGNDHTKKRTVTIKCKAPGCTKGVTVGALRFSHEWCHEEAAKKWNTRAADTALAAAEARIAELGQALRDAFNEGWNSAVGCDYLSLDEEMRDKEFQWSQSDAAALLKEKE
ncbi:MAG: hypothetical protein CL539_06095 [Alcanivorax sp.]|uniref:Lar family restriction alleviation protein n=1 Tax=unclassified Alcanivorax TaxID=2638842 RepID=UPI000C8FD5BF|nr:MULTISPECIES: Lar family restriction alleviation protein [unclassified Alcanivorax]MAC14236.1 hypothetical protein [Alcanivorax sp.]|tara:strand:+ start:1485 stop:1874 length:390 start_codon:yes stop_codon:yes gene_type:complete